MSVPNPMTIHPIVVKTTNANLMEALLDHKVIMVDPLGTMNVCA